MSKITAPARAANGQTWCGPYALALIGGMTVEQANEVVRKQLKKKPGFWVRGMYGYEFAAAIKKIGYKKFEWKYVPKSKRMNLRHYQDYMKPNRLYVVNVTHHYVVVDTSTWSVADNNLGGWKPITEAKAGGKRVCQVAELKRIEPEKP